MSQKRRHRDRQRERDAPVLHFIHTHPNITGSSGGDCAAQLFVFHRHISLDVPLSPVVMSSGDASEQSRRVSVLSWDQVRRLDSILGESVPIHGRGNFPTLSVQPRQIVQVRPRFIQLFSLNLSSYYSFTAKCPGAHMTLLME